MYRSSFRKALSALALVLVLSSCKTEDSGDIPNPTESNIGGIGVSISEGETEKETGAETDSESETEKSTEAESESETETETEPETETETETETKTETETESETETETETESETETETESETKTETETESETESKAGTEAEVKAEYPKGNYLISGERETDDEKQHESEKESMAETEKNAENESSSNDPARKNVHPDPRNPADVIISLSNVTDYGAVADGTLDGKGTDNTKAFEKALRAADKAGGGTVYVPKGIYYIKGDLKIPTSCTLAGEWYDPDTDPDKMLAGTVLVVGGGRGLRAADPFITVGASAAVLGLTIVYPNQGPEDAKRYPATILIKDSAAGDGTQHSSSVICVTMPNSYFAIDATKGNQLFNIDKVRTSAFSEGLSINECYDCARVYSLTVSPKYYSEFVKASGGDSSSALSQMTDYMRENTTGVTMMRTDWQMMHDIKIESCAVGFSCERNPKTKEETAGSGSIIGFEIKNCKIGINCEYGGYRFSSGTVDARGKDAVAVKLADTVVANYGFYDTVFSSDGRALVIEKGSSGIVSVQNCRFDGFFDTAVEINGGSAEIQSSFFKGNGTGIYIGDSASSAISASNTFEGVVTKVENKLTRTNAVVIENDIEPIPDENFDLTLPAPPAPYNTENIVYVTDFGATGKAKCGADNPDDTKAFERAIAAVAKDGGIVFVPAGYYDVKGNLTIPKGVELRGIHTSMHVTSGEGSVIFVTSGKGKSSGNAFITLEESSSVRGLTFWYPEQNYKKIINYPYLIRGNGKNVVIRDICVGNASRAIDLGSADCGGHYVSGVTGCVLKNGIKLDGSTSAGYILNTHFNLSFYSAVWGTKLKDASGSFGSDDMFTTLLGKLNSSLTAYEFGSAVDETLLYVFNYRAQTGMEFTGGFDGTLYGCGVDGSVLGVSIKGDYKKPLRFLNFADDIVPGSHLYGNIAVYIGASDTSEIIFVSSGASSYNYVPEGLVRLDSGKLKLQSFSANVSPIGKKCGAISVNGGEAVISGVNFMHVGKLDSNGAFAKQSSKGGTTDLYVSDGKVSLRGAVGRYFFNHNPAGGEISELIFTVTD